MATKFSIEAVFTADGKGLVGTIDKVEKKLTRLEKAGASWGKFSGSLDKVSSGFTKVGALAGGAALATGALIKDVVMTGAEFDHTLVAAGAKFEDAFGNPIRRGSEGFKQIALAAQDIGAKTEFNAQQGAAALKDLASAGFGVNQAIAALPGIVNLATASEIDLTSASNMAVKSLGAFGLMTKDAGQLGKNLTRVTDVMAVAAGKTSASMEGLFESIQEGGPVAISTGQSMETFMAMASSLAGAGIEGSVAGTTLKNTFLSLAAPTKRASAELARLHVATKDSKGNLRDAVAIFGDLEKATAGMGTASKSAALEHIFGKIPIAGVTALLGKTDGVLALRKALEGSAGATKTMAGIMRNDAKGDIDEFTSAIDGMKDALFSANEGPIRDTIQSMTSWVRANQGDIIRGIGDSVKWVGDNFQDIVKWAKPLGEIALGFYALDKGVKAVNTGIEAFKIGKSTVTGVGKAALWSAGKLGMFNASAAEGVSGLKGLRDGLNFSKVGGAINGVQSKLGKAGLLGAAALVGYEFGTWLNDTLGISEAIDDLLADITGINDELDRAGGRAKKRGTQPGGNMHYADGTVMSVRGDVLSKGTDWMSHTSKFSDTKAREISGIGHFGNMSALPGAEREAERSYASLMSWGRALPQVTWFEPQTVSLQGDRLERALQVIAEKDSAEITIRDESGKAEVTKAPKRAKINLKPTGAF